jgi:hypothetical protein
VVKFVGFIPGLNRREFSATCPAGDRVVGGGFGFDYGEGEWYEVHVAYNGPADLGIQAWTVWALNLGGNGHSIEVRAVCLHMGS